MNVKKFRPRIAPHIRESVLSIARQMPDIAQFQIPHGASNVSIKLFPVEQLNLFAVEGAKLRVQYKRARKDRQKGLQYSLGIKLRKVQRKIAYRKHTVDFHERNNESFEDRWAYRMYTVVLDEAIRTLREYLTIRSPRAAEVMAWVERKTNEPYSFEACCERYFKINDDAEEIGALDPDVLRLALQREVRAVFGANLPHAALLRKAIEDAESGDEAAIEWILNEQATELSFAECCDALGFDPDVARRQIRLPTPVLDLQDGLEAQLDRIFDRYLGPLPTSAMAA